MATLSFTVSENRKTLILAACKIRGETLEQRFEGYFKDVESSTGFDHTEEDPTEIAAMVSKARQKGVRADNLRNENSQGIQEK